MNSCQNHLAWPVKKVVCILLLSGFQRCFDDGGLFLVCPVCQLIYWCEVWSAVCCVLVTSRFQSSLLDSPAMCEKEVECVSLPCHYIAS